MNTAKFTPFNYKKKYLPRPVKGFPVPNELLQFMDCLVSISYSDNTRKRKVNHNESEIGTKLLFAALPCRNIKKFKNSWLTIKDLSDVCKGYSEKSIRKGAVWLVKKGLFKKRAGSHNKAEFRVNYIKASFEEISSDIARQLENDVKKEDVVFRGIRYLTSTWYKRDWDSKAVGHFTHVPLFLPQAKSEETKEEIVFDYYENPIFDSIDGNTLKVILQFTYLMNYKQKDSVYDSPEVEVKVTTLMKLCGLSKNKVESALKYLIDGNFLRSYTIKRNSRKYIFNFSSHRYKKVRKQLDIRKRKRKIDKFRRSFAVTGQLENSSLPVMDIEPLPVLPSQVDYNKDNILINIQEIENKYQSEEENNNVTSTSHQIEKKEDDALKKIQEDCLFYFRNLQIPYPIFQELLKKLKEIKDRNEKISSTADFIESYNNSQVDPSMRIDIIVEDTALEPVF